jgi:hypothetical protein
LKLPFLSFYGNSLPEYPKSITISVFDSVKAATSAGGAFISATQSEHDALYYKRVFNINCFFLCQDYISAVSGRGFLCCGQDSFNADIGLTPPDFCWYIFTFAKTLPTIQMDGKEFVK